MKILLAIIVGKIIIWVTRTLKIGGGSAAPGLFALRIDPELVEGLVKKIPKNIVITGTNGKTTTARMIAHLCKESGLKFIRNHTGSNLERGIASTLIQNSYLHPRGVNSSFDLGIWELDEAAFNTVSPKIKPDIVVFLNVFRDQLDRYGEVDSVVKKWAKTLQKMNKKTIVLVNGDDANTSKLSKYFKGKVERFGVENHKISGESLEKKNSKVKLDFEAKNIKLKGLNGTNFDLRIRNMDLRIKLPLPGIYHVYDAVAAVAAGIHLGLPIHRLNCTLTHFQPAFGRVEKFELTNPSLAYIFLIKNPAGATQVFETIAPNFKKNDRLLIALNDNLADGTDVSWIWDAQFEKLRTTNYKLPTTCSGTRAADLAIRLKYAGFDPEQITVESNLERAFRGVQRGLQGHLFILPTYTAMLELQKILTKQGIKHHYWEEK